MPAAPSSRISSRDKYQMQNACSQILLTYTLPGVEEGGGHGTTRDVCTHAGLRSMLTWLPGNLSQLRCSFCPFSLPTHSSICTSPLSAQPFFHSISWGELVIAQHWGKKFPYEMCPKNEHIFFPHPMLIPLLLHVCSGPQGAGLGLFHMGSLPLMVQAGSVDLGSPGCSPGGPAESKHRFSPRPCVFPLWPW